MINYTWNVKTVDTYPSHTDDNDNTQSDVVYNVHWRLMGTDDVNNDADGNSLTAEVYGSIGLDVSDLSSFTAFADLTESGVQAWVETAIGSDEVTALKAGIDAQITEKITPTSVSRTIGE
tara:strand:+ start:1229 stop:1588 length:360 start_codon:yes stop_codon:yes gene_type:complete